MTPALRFVENKATGISETPSKGVVEMTFNRSGACLMCGHTPVVNGVCCQCQSCICCTTRRPEES